MNGSYGNCITNQHIVENSGNNQQASVMGQMASRSDRGGGNADTSAANSIQQQFVYQQQPIASSSLTQNINPKEELNVSTKNYHYCKFLFLSCMSTSIFGKTVLFYSV